MSENVDFSRPQSQLRNTFPPRFYPPLQSNSFQRIFPGRFVKNSLFARNNPHPNRVTHIKGLLDAPICCVQDAMFDGRRMGLPLPVFDPRIYGQRSGMVQYPSIRERQMLAGGPDVAWREELERLTKQVVTNAAMGRSPMHQQQRRQSRLRGRGELASRSGNRAPVLAALDDVTILEMLCRILQTDSVPAIQAWLSSAPDSEKDLVMNMLGMAATGELTYGATPRGEEQKQRPGTQSSGIYKQTWNPASSVVDDADIKEVAADKEEYAQPNDESQSRKWLQTQRSSRQSPVQNEQLLSRRGLLSEKGPRLRKVPLSRSGSKATRFEYVSTWTGCKEPLMEEKSE
eukprot:m.4258 g.4258  ORF g.4258 m.4258 type:complete len:344 (+) comp10454_c0_seq2:93-1124(+)